MRMLLTARMDTEAANRAVNDGTMPKIINEVVEHLKPEAAYFAPVDGVRTCMLVFDMQESAQMPPISERFFQAGAKVSLQPVMNLDDLRTGLSNLAR
ncbi:hypothetical protein [Streptomyces sp. BE147]|uniref:hypothetical protein n=1 Tax=unclassified Streptomyces TaxID=2593676 RepID=UPI002E78DDCD|nr:hypothetical protein [Streptomyces sp. BE147]MEE1740080.1 hypothetical protein [Streptomyces sp. BE147]